MNITNITPNQALEKLNDMIDVEGKTFLDIINLVKDFPNDQELGREIRKTVENFKREMHTINGRYK